MPRVRVNIILAMVLALGLGGCAPRSTPAPVIMGGAGSVVSEYPAPPRPEKATVVVQPGDTIYAISRYHQTALQAIIEANSLEAPFVIKPGQVLRLPDQPGEPPASTPAGSLRTYAKASTIESAGEQAVETHRLSPAVAGTATVQTQKKPPAAAAKKEPAIASANSTVASSGEDQTRPLSLEAEPSPVQPKPVHEARPIATEKKAAMTPGAVPFSVQAPPASLNRHVRFLWPARGPILSDFGPKQNGLHNDGINIAMPPNGPVVAAADGVVSYAGNGLRGYGNLLLLRHEGGWVTAYAHNTELLVEKGARVKRGQLIAKAGRSGGVSQDQLHFEVRQGTKAIDPKPLLVGG